MQNLAIKFGKNYLFPKFIAEFCINACVQNESFAYLCVQNATSSRMGHGPIPEGTSRGHDGHGPLKARLSPTRPGAKKN